MKPLELDIRKSLYSPAKVKITGKDGEVKTYTAQKLTREFRETLSPIEVKIQTGKSEAMYEWVSLMFNVEPEILDALEYWEVEDIYVYTSKVIEETALSRGLREMESLETKLRKMKEEMGLPKDKPVPKQPKRTIPSEKKSKRSGGKD